MWAENGFLQVTLVSKLILKVIQSFFSLITKTLLYWIGNDDKDVFFYYLIKTNSIYMQVLYTSSKNESDFLMFTENSNKLENYLKP